MVRFRLNICFHKPKQIRSNMIIISKLKHELQQIAQLIQQQFIDVLPRIIYFENRVNYDRSKLICKVCQILYIANINSQKQKMVSNIMDLFRTTNKGIYNMTELPATTSLSKSFFGLSVGLEIVFMLIFIGIFGLSVFRSVKKIKNPKFKTEKDEDVNNQEEAENVEDQTNAKQTNDNLIYRFDEEDHQKQKKGGEGEQDQKKQGQENAQQNSQDEYDKDHDENQERFLEIDSQLLFLQPFLIGHIVCNNVFATNYITLILIVVSLILFFIFNIKGACANVKWLSLLFMLPAIGSFVPVFMNDLDMST